MILYNIVRLIMAFLPSRQVQSIANNPHVWPYTSRYFDRETMSGKLLRRIIDRKTFDLEGILGYLQVRNDTWSEC